jgi:quercetin dioxygenase-like cupin family protein
MEVTMAEVRRSGLVDEVQVFQTPQSQQDECVDLASSPNSHISNLRVEPGESVQLPIQDSDRILVVLSGACTVTSPSGAHELTRGKGFLVPADLACRVTNEGDEPVGLFSMQTRRSTPYVTNVMSDVVLKIPAELVDGMGLGNRLYAYVMDRRTLGISPLIMEEWNQASALRMNCKFVREGDMLHATLPERVVRWYGLDDLGDGDYTLTHDRRRSRVRVDLTPLLARQARV